MNRKVSKNKYEMKGDIREYNNLAFSPGEDLFLSFVYITKLINLMNEINTR